MSLLKGCRVLDWRTAVRSVASLVVEIQSASARWLSAGHEFPSGKPVDLMKWTVFTTVLITSTSWLVLPDALVWCCASSWPLLQIDNWSWFKLKSPPPSKTPLTHNFVPTWSFSLDNLSKHSKTISQQAGEQHLATFWWTSWVLHRKTFRSGLKCFCRCFPTLYPLWNHVIVRIHCKLHETCNNLFRIWNSYLDVWSLVHVVMCDCVCSCLSTRVKML